MHGSRTTLSWTMALMALIVSQTGPAAAQEEPAPTSEQSQDGAPVTGDQTWSFPIFVGTSDTVLEQLHVASSDVYQRKTQTTLMVERLRGGLFFSPGLSLQSELTFAPLRGALRQPHKDHFLSDQGLYLQQLYLKAEDDNLIGYLGKFDPQISWAADNAPGVFGADYVSDYQVHEMLGAGGAIRWQDSANGRHVLAGSMFQADNTPLGQSAFTSPRFGQNDTGRAGRLHYGDGGIANTRYPRSGVIRLDGDLSAGDMPNLNYHLAYAQLHRGVGQSANQQNFIVGLDHTLQIDDELFLQSQVEYAHILDNGGSPVSGQAGQSASQKADYLTTGATLWWNNWNISAVHTVRDLKHPDDGSGNVGRNSYDQLWTTSLGYSWQWGLWAAVGWKHEHGYDGLLGAPASTQTVGFQLGYHQDF